MKTTYKEYIENNKEKSKIEIGDYVLLSDNQSLISPWIYPVGKVVDINKDDFPPFFALPDTHNVRINQIKLKIKTYPQTEKKFKYVQFWTNLSEIDKIIKKEDCDRYIKEWLIKIKAKKYNII